ncbi:MAG: GGDEF domain-containing protein [Alphaproteobacteria bacterium]
MLDARTLSLVMTYVAAVSVLGMVLLAFGHRNEKSLPHVAAATLTIAIGMLGLTLRDMVPGFVSVVVANTLLVLGAVYLLASFRHFFGRKTHWPWLALAPVITAASFLYFWAVSDQVNIRMIIFSLLFGGGATWIGIEFLRPVKDEVWRGARIVTGLGFLVTGLVHAWRVVYVASSDQPLELMAGSIAFIVPALIGILTSIVTNFGFALVVGQRLQSRYDRLARVDQLTELLNRRGFDALVEAEISRALRHNTPLSVLIGDLDRFKRVNDSLGHSAGDAVLTEAAALIKRSARKEDHVGRLGGDEIALLLPGIDGDGAARTAERLREAVAAGNIDCGHRTKPMTMSFGVATLGRDGKTWLSLYAAADRRLYAAKQAGRNRVVAA